MAENKRSVLLYCDLIHTVEKSTEELWREIIDIQWSFDDRFDRVFLVPEQVEYLLRALSELRKRKAIEVQERLIISDIIKLGRKRYLEFKEHLHNQPRKEAQKFIGKKNIRKFIFTRDGYKCLKCGIDYALTIDHINPIHNNGENKLYNLQTLCRSCNSWKGTKYIDYR